MAEKIFENVKVPYGLDETQAERARWYVKGTIMEGLTIEELGKKYDMGGSSTLYSDKYLKNVLFNRYVNALKGELASDELADFKVFANNIKQQAMKPNATHKEKELYLTVFGWMNEYYGEVM